MAAFVSTGKTSGGDSRQVSRGARAVSTLLGCALLCAVLPGCACKKPAGKAWLYPETIGVATGQKFALQADNNPFSRAGNWLYQWQYIIDQTTNGDWITTDIPEATCSKFIKKADLDDTKLYRCMIYRPGKFPQTNYTAILSLQVSQRSIMLAGVNTTVSGAFKPGAVPTGSNRKCACSYKDGIVFATPDNSNWWLPQGNNPTSATITDSTTGIDYSKVPVYLLVSDDSFTDLKCWRLTSPQALMQFPVDPAAGYMFRLFFPGPQLPSAGAKFVFTVKWQ